MNAPQETAARTQEFKPGDKVRLNSGGPLLVVQDVYLFSQQVLCRWHDKDDGAVREHHFAAAGLTADSR